MNPVDINQMYIFTLMLKIKIKILKLKLVIRLKYKNIFVKHYTPDWSEEVFVMKKVKS